MKRRISWKKLGFTQARPKRPGLYFVNVEREDAHPPQFMREGWEIANVFYDASGWSHNLYDNSDANAHWRISRITGIEQRWEKGMWTKGPIQIDWQAPSKQEAARDDER